MLFQICNKCGNEVNGNSQLTSITIRERNGNVMHLEVCQACAIKAQQNCTESNLLMEQV